MIVNFNTVKSIDYQKLSFNSLIVNAFSLSLLFFLIIYPSTILTAQCRYVSHQSDIQTRPQTLAKVKYLSEKVEVQARKSADKHYLDLHFETTEAAFSIRQHSSLTLVLANGETVILQAMDMLHSDAYFTCCDTVWLMKVAYFIPIEQRVLLTNHKVVEIRIELNNRQKTYSLKDKKQDRIAKLLACVG